MVCHKRLDENNVVGSWSWGDEKLNSKGLSLGIRNGDNLNYSLAVVAENVKTADGEENRIVVNKSTIEELGFKLVVE